jgi:zinc D-Ala-D-Ala carboxypeptidase
LDQYAARVEAMLRELAIPATLIVERALPMVYEPQELVVAETAPEEREHLLVPLAATAWREMSAAARADGITLQIVSAFRGIERQGEIIRRKLALGISLDQILAVSAPPGYSEHHSGCAVDLNTPGSPPLEPTFEDTDAFRWLAGRAALFGFRLSFPRGNQFGYAYEPWHWCFHGTEV